MERERRKMERGKRRFLLTKKIEIMSPISEEHVTLTRLRKRKMVKPLPMNDMDDLVQDNEL